MSNKIPIKANYTGSVVSSLGEFESTDTVGTSAGGTGLYEYTQGDILYYNSGYSLSKLPKSTVASSFLSNSGSNNNPAWATISTGDLPSGIDATKIANGTVSNTEFQYINSVTSNVQDQLDAKVAKAGDTMTGGLSLDYSGLATLTIKGTGDTYSYSTLQLWSNQATDKYWGFVNRKYSDYPDGLVIEYFNGSSYTQELAIESNGDVNVLVGDINVVSGKGYTINNTATAGNYLRGNGTRFVDASIQAGDLPSGIDASKISSGVVSNTEFDYLNGVTSAIQTQINAKLATATYESTDSIDPGHKHSKLWASDGNPEAVTVSTTGKVGIGTTSPTHVLDIASSVANTNNITFLVDSNFNCATNGTYYDTALFIQARINTSGDQTANNTGYNRGLYVETLLRENAGTITSVIGLNTEAGSYGPGGADVSATISNLYVACFKGHRRSSTIIDYAYGIFVTGIDGTNAWDIYAADADANNYFAGNVGIGTISPSQELDLIGNLELENTTSDSTGVIYKGADRFIHNFKHPTGDTAVPVGQNTFVGVNAGNFTMGSTATQTYHGSNNTAVGISALYSNTLGYHNSAVGLNALRFNTEGHSNSAIGVNAFYSNTTGYNNSAIGRNTLYYNTTGYNNSAIGFQAGRYIADGSTHNETSSNSLYLGANTKALANGDDNEVVIGYDTTGFGSNTTAYGNSSMTKHIFQAGKVGIGGTNPLKNINVFGALSGSTGSFTNQPTIRITQTKNETYNVGDFHGCIEFYSEDSNWGPGIQCYIGAVTTRGPDIVYADTGIAIGVSSGATKADYTNPHTVFDNYGNLLIGGFFERPSNAQRVIALKQANSAPSSVDADTAALWVEDIAGTAGKAGLHMMAESGTEKLIIAGIIRKTTTGNPTQVHEGLMCINTYDNNVKIYADGGWRTLATW